MKAVFKIIAMPLRPHGSDDLLNIQVLGVVRRIPATYCKAAATSASRGPQEKQPANQVGDAVGNQEQLTLAVEPQSDEPVVLLICFSFLFIQSSVSVIRHSPWLPFFSAASTHNPCDPHSLTPFDPCKPSPLFNRTK